MASMKPNAHGLVPVVVTVDEAGYGLRSGEIRGVPPEVAEKMIERKAARIPTPEDLAAHEKERQAERERHPSYDASAASGSARKTKSE